LHILGIIITVVTILGPKTADAEYAKGKNDEESGTKTNNKSKRLSCGSCGQPTSPSKLNGKTKPTDNGKPDGKPTTDTHAELVDVKAKSAEPHINEDAIKSIVKQNKTLYTRLQPSSDPENFSDYGEPDRKPITDTHTKLVDVKAKSEEPHINEDAIKSIAKQSKTLYTRLQPSRYPENFSDYGEPEAGNEYANGNTNVAQTGYADVDMSSRQVAYDDLDMQAFR
jgi:hypothetical protein